MGAELDRLEIQVETQATKANNQLDKLVDKLDRVSSSLSHLNSSGLTGLSNGVAKFAQASAQLSNVKTADFTRLTKNIQSLANLNNQQIYNAASSIKTLSSAVNSLGGVSANSLQVAEVANAISKLGGANVQRAITNLPALATAMNDLLTTLSKAPAVSNNVVNLTRALANLSSQGAKVGTAGNSLVTNTNRIGTAMEKTTKKTRSFSSVLGSLYQKYFWVARAGSKLWDSVKDSMGYVEVYNYFDKAFGQVADSAVGHWEDAGYDSAQKYYTSFSERAKQLTTKMTGFAIADNGMLESAGGKSLGINPAQLMNYQAMFAQMSNSMGVTAETSLKLSTALTEIGADLASVKNMDFDKVWKDMASGLAGMSRTLDKYGANIRNVNLQQKLTGLGINANIAALNQNEKALLRTIILLDSTRYAWGDLAETIDQPANQLRLLQANFGNLARTIGNIFLPIVAKVLPYINALVIALQRLAEWIVKLLGFEDFDWGGSSGIGGSEFDDLLGSIGDTEDGLNDATGAAKKLRTQLLGIDELNVLNQDDDSAGSGIGGLGGYGGILEGALDKILEEYQRAWDEAFANMEERYNQFADNVANAFKEKGLFGVGEYFGEELTKALNSIPWDSIYEGARGFGKGLADFLSGLISPELFGAVGKTIASALNTAIYAALSFGENFDFYDFGASIATGINEFFETFDFEALAETLNVWVDGVEDSIRGFLSTITWESILEGVGDFLGELELDTVEFLIGAFVLKNTAENLKEMVTGAITSKIAFATNPINIPNLLLAFGKISIYTSPGMTGLIGIVLGDLLNHSFLDPREWEGWIGDLSNKIYESVNSAVEWIGENVILKAFEQLGNSIKESIEEFKSVFNWEETFNFFVISGQSFSKAKEAFENEDWGELGKNILLGVIDGFAGVISFITEPIDNFFQELWNNICEVFGIHSPAENMKPLGEFILLGIVEGFKGVFTFFDEAVSEWWTSNVSPWFTTEQWQTLFANIQLAFETKWNELVKWWQESALYSWWNNDVVPWFGLEKWQELMTNIKTALNNVWTEVVNWWTNTAIYRWYNDNVKPWFNEKNWTFSGIKDGLSKAFNAAIDAIKGIWNAFAKWINDALTFDFEGFTKSFEVLGETYEIGIPAFSVSLGKLPTFYNGGYVPTSYSMFMAGENGVPELLGTVGGRTAVAGGAEITGIREAVERTSNEEIALLKQQNYLLERILEKEGIAVFDRREALSALREEAAREGWSFG